MHSALRYPSPLSMSNNRSYFVWSLPIRICTSQACKLAPWSGLREACWTPPCACSCARTPSTLPSSSRGRSSASGLWIMESTRSGRGTTLGSSPKRIQGPDQQDLRLQFRNKSCLASETPLVGRNIDDSTWTSTWGSCISDLTSLLRGGLFLSFASAILLQRGILM